MAGTLYLCAMPIGNLDDITLRTLKLLESADVIAAEDTRNTLKLLNHYEIKTPMTSYHEHNKAGKGPVLLERLQKGENIALVTDAGMPGISDPGADLVRLCHAAGVPVTVAPGASAAVTALVLSGLDTRRFVFEGFLPPEKKERREILRTLEREHRTMVFYEAPHRLLDTLEELCGVFGAERQTAAARELTKKFEEVRRDTLADSWRISVNMRRRANLCWSARVFRWRNNGTRNSKAGHRFLLRNIWRAIWRRAWAKKKR